MPLAANLTLRDGRQTKKWVPRTHLEVSESRGTPKIDGLFHGKSQTNMEFAGTPYFRTPPLGVSVEQRCAKKASFPPLEEHTRP